MGVRAVLGMLRKSFGTARQGIDPKGSQAFQATTRTQRFARDLGGGGGKLVDAATDLISTPARLIGVGGVGGLVIGGVAWYVALTFLGVM